MAFVIGKGLIVLRKGGAAKGYPSVVRVWKLLLNLYKGEFLVLWNSRVVFGVHVGGYAFCLQYRDKYWHPFGWKNPFKKQVS